jgi:glycosyltransferase involved in cell wall biosynthesis
VPCYDIVVPARNEETTVAAVVRSALAAPGVGRVVVVDDGSTDGTAAVARAAGALVVAGAAPGTPGSKALALARGVAASDSPVLVFFDADILGTRPWHFAALAEPVLDGGFALSCGIIPYGRLRDRIFLRLPPITGLRALRREVFDAVPPAKRNGFQIEIMINEVVARGRLPGAMRVLPGLRHRSKIAKEGWRRGFPAWAAMTGELLACLRVVPLWTYGSWLRRLTVLPPSASAGESSTPPGLA